MASNPGCFQDLSLLQANIRKVFRGRALKLLGIVGKMEMRVRVASRTVMAVLFWGSLLAPLANSRSLVSPWLHLFLTWLKAERGQPGRSVSNFAVNFSRNSNTFSCKCQ